MSWWVTLGVPSDADERTIKRAYSQLIKQHRPDEDPQRFSEIRQAFEAARQALKGARYRQAQTQPMAEPLIESVTPKPDDASEISTEPSAETSQDTTQDTTQEKTVAEPVESAKPIEDVLMDLIVRWRQKGEKHNLLAEIRALPQLSNFDQFNRASAFMLDWLVNRIFLQGDKAFLYKRDFIQSLERQFSWTSTEVQWAQQYPQHDLRPLSEVFYDNPAASVPQAETVQSKSNPWKVLWGVFFRILMAIWLWGLTEEGWADQSTLKLAGAGFLWFIWLEATFTNYRVIRKVSTFWGRQPFRPLHLFVFWFKWAVAGLLAFVVGSAWLIGYLVMVVSLFVVMGSHLIAGDWQSSLLSLLPLLIVLVVGFFITRWIFKKLSKSWNEFLEELERYY
jgi:hypothetical protein